MIYSRVLFFPVSKHGGGVFKDIHMSDSAGTSLQLSLVWDEGLMA